MEETLGIKLDHLKLLAKNFIFDCPFYPEDAENIQGLIEEEKASYDQPKAGTESIYSASNDDIKEEEEENEDATSQSSI